MAKATHEVNYLIHTKTLFVISFVAILCTVCADTSTLCLSGGTVSCDMGRHLRYMHSQPQSTSPWFLGVSICGR